MKYRKGEETWDSDDPLSLAREAVVIAVMVDADFGVDVGQFSR